VRANGMAWYRTSFFQTYIAPPNSIDVFAVLLRFGVEIHNFGSIKITQFELSITLSQPLA
jgi:hypothetical protein